MRRRPSSIAARLTLLVGMIAVAVFSVVGTLLYVALERELLRRAAEELAVKRDLVAHLLSEVHEPAELGNLTHMLDDTILTRGDLRVWITAMDGRELYGGEPPVKHADDIAAPFDLTRKDRVPMRAIFQRMAATDTLPELEVLVAIDARPAQRTLHAFGIVLVGLCAAGIAAMLLLGMRAVRRGLRPLGELSTQAHAIGPQTLSRRLSEHVLPAELVDLAQSFNRVLDRLEESHRQLEEFNADVAHELRTPLSNLIGGTEVALSRARPADELRDVLASNLEDLGHMRVMINDMLFLARADRGERAGGVATVRLDELVREVAEFFDPLFEERRVTLDIRGEASATGDANLLRRAITNLVANAVRYTEADNAIRVSVASDRKTATLRVRNPGPPIASEHLPHIFDRFYRADGARHPGGESHGLGLAIVKAIVKMHGGGVFADSADGVTEVGFSLPLGR